MSPERSAWRAGSCLRVLLYGVCFPLIVLGLLGEKLLELYKTHPGSVDHFCALTRSPGVWFYEGILLTLFLVILFLAAGSENGKNK